MSDAAGGLGPAAAAVLAAVVASGEDLARELDVSRVSVHRWLRGKQPPDPENAIRLARAVRRRALKLLDLAAQLEAAAVAKTTEREED